ncbi:peptidylprolyl isomerase [Candidatus Woesearchaeota archaeon]|nr:peptidylprolyl isomerase [Candidatus Woesearchaeota archaeon]
MEVIKENDFVELDYTGRVAGGGEVFDTTSASVAKESGIFDEHTAYGPAVVCIGKRHLVIGLDKQLVGKEIGKSYTIKLPAEEAFGKKNGKLIQLVSTAKFRQQQMTPFPGMQVNIDGIVGTVRTVAGGRTIVDFNHPLSGREIEYEVTVKRIIADLSEKVNAMLRLIGVSANAVKVSVTADGAASIEFPQEVPEELKKDMVDKLRSAIPELKGVSFNVKKSDAEKKEEQPSVVTGAETSESTKKLG